MGEYWRTFSIIEIIDVYIGNPKPIIMKQS